MRELTDLEMGSVAGGDSSGAAAELADHVCSKFPDAVILVKDDPDSAQVGGFYGFFGGSIGGTRGGTTVVVKCGGRVEDAARDKEEKDENES